MPLKKPKNMTFEELTLEMKTSADQLQPINARRKLVHDEILSRGDVEDAKNRIKALSAIQKRGIFEELKKEFGE
jgi:hypothetical protein